MRRKVENVNQSATDEVFDAIHGLMHLYRARQYRVLRDSPHEITHLEGKVLGFFGRHPGAMAGDLAAHSGRDKAQIARLLSGLKERGLLQAEVDADDRRKTRLHLSDTGRELLRSTQRSLRQVAQRSMEGFDADEAAQLLSLLQRLRANLDGAEAEDAGGQAG